MPYDATLDECLFSKEMEIDDDRLSVKVFSYNKGTKKLQISRESRNAQGELRFAKLGRLTKDEISSLIPSIQEAIQNMD